MCVYVCVYMCVYVCVCVCVYVCVCFLTLRATVITHQSLCSEASQLEEKLECGDIV